LRRLLIGAALALSLALSAAVPAAHASDPPASAPAVVPPDTVGTAMLGIETRPERLQVYVDGEFFGWSPIEPVEHPARAIHVRVLPPDPRRFGLGRDAMDVTLVRGTSTTLFFDLRPSILIETEPTGAIAMVTDRAAGDSLLGATPVSVPPGIVEGAAVRFSAPAHADTVIAGTTLEEGEGGFAHVELRRIVLSSPGPTPKTPVYKKAWLRWTMVGVGAALSVSAIPLHHKADDWYDQYLSSSNVDEIPYLYDQTKKYDRLAGGALVVGQTLLVSGIVMLLLGQRP
jgi:hypothetical protein